MPPLPTMSLRCATESQPLIRDIARALRDRSGLADVLHETLSHNGAPATATGGELARRVASLESSVQALAVRVVGLENAHVEAAAPEPEGDGPVSVRLDVALAGLAELERLGWLAPGCRDPEVIAGAILRDAEERKVVGVTDNHVTQFCVNQLIARHNEIQELDPDVIAEMHADIVAESAIAN